NGRYLRSHGDAAPLRPDRAQAGPDRSRALRRRAERPDGGRSSARRAELVHGFPLISRFVRTAAAIFAAVLLCVLGTAAQAAGFTPLTVQTKTGAHVFQVEVASDDATRAQGLMYRRKLDPDKGMLFDFGRDQPVAMWMQ